MAIRVNIDPIDITLRNATAEINFDVIGVKVKNELLRALESGVIVGNGHASHLARLLHDHKALPHFTINGTRSRGQNQGYLWINSRHKNKFTFKKALKPWLQTTVAVLLPSAETTKIAEYTDAWTMDVGVNPAGLEKVMRAGIWGITSYDPKADDVRLEIVQKVKRELGIQQ